MQAQDGQPRGSHGALDAMVTRNVPTTSSPEATRKQVEPRHWAQRAARAVLILFVLAGVGWVWIHPDLCLPGQSATIGGSGQFSINGLPVTAYVNDENTATVGAGHYGSPTVEGLLVGDSVRGPWWWGRVTVVRIDPDVERLNRVLPDHCNDRVYTPEPEAEPCTSGQRRGSTPCFEPSPLPPDCILPDGGGGTVTVRWMPW